MPTPTIHRMKVGRFEAASRNALASSLVKGLASVSSMLGGSTSVATFSPTMRRRWAIFSARDRMRCTFTTCDGAWPASSRARYMRPSDLYGSAPVPRANG